MKKDDVELPPMPDIPGYRANLFDPDVTAVEVNTAEDLIKAYAMDTIVPYKQRISDLEAQLEAIGAGGVSGQPITSQRRGEPVELDRYDAGYLGGQDGMAAHVWHDIIRAELDRAYDFYMDQLDRVAPQPAEPEKEPPCET